MSWLLALALLTSTVTFTASPSMGEAGAQRLEEVIQSSSLNDHDKELDLYHLLPSPPPSRGREPRESSGVSQVRYVMGTLWTVEAQGPDAEAAVAAAFEEIKRLDRLLSTYKPESELSIINREAATRPVPVSPETRALLARALDHAASSDGAFDPTVGPVVALWGFKHLDYRFPAPDAIKDALARVGHRHVRLAPEGVRFVRPGLEIDLGAIGKGYAVDRAIALLKAHGCTAGLVDAGGNQAAFGPPVTIGLKHPRDEDALIGAIALENRAVSTSGDAERGFWKDGVRYGHVIDPRTGMPVRNRLSVTVVAPDAESADALSTALYVLGPERGLALLARHPGAEALFVEAGETPDDYRLIPSAGFTRL